MSYKQGEYVVLKKQAIARKMFDFTILCEDIARDAKVGQFVHVLAPGHTLRRPISICEIDKNAGTIRIVFEVKGDGTKVVSRINENEMIDIIGPLGNGFTLLDKSKKAICIGGGIGIPPMLEVAKHYGENATVISGFRNSGAVILQDDFRNVNAKAILCTDDGSVGIKGFVTDALKSCFKIEKPDVIYACGPMPMLKAIAKISAENNIKTEVSLEERMGCGVGACLVCATKIKRDGEIKVLHVCKDGPVFNSEEVVWDD